MTLQEYISFWQETYDKHQSRPTTYAAHNYVFKNHILPSLGDIPLSELTSEMVGEFLEERRRFGNHRPSSSGLGEETMRHIHRLLQQCLDQAMRDGLIGDNPARAFHYSKPKKVNADVLTPLEMEDYLDAAERLGHLPMFMLALTAGLRQGELIALKWNDLNVKNRTLTISEQRSVERRELIEYGSETRTITLTSEVIDLLIMEHTKHPKSPLMFMHPATQRPYSPQMVRRMHNEIIKEAGLDHIRFTDLRHTCAVLSLRNGMETKELARMLGHYRPSITRQDYEPYLPHKVQKDEDIPNEATQGELQQAANPCTENRKAIRSGTKTVPPMQTEPAPVHPTQSESASEPIANDNELADMVYVPGFGWIRSEGPNHVEYAEDMYENGNKIGIMG